MNEVKNKGSRNSQDASDLLAKIEDLSFQTEQNGSMNTASGRNVRSNSVRMTAASESMSSNEP